MRTTLEIDDDLLETAKQMARDRGISLGHMISDLARGSLATTSTHTIRNGVRLFEKTFSEIRPDLHLVNQLRDDE